jgi:hypothetical protein
MNNALIGYSGFVGSTLLLQSSFESLFRSTNIGEIEGMSFNTLVCAGAPAQKWIANREPEEDLKKINQLISHLKKVKCKTFILISTVDVFKSPLDVDENTTIEEDGLHPYGLHRRLLEKFVAANFDNFLIVRLPGLVGPGLRKNIIFDFLNNNNLNQIESRSVFQFYPMVNLWNDIQIALKEKLKLIHLTAEPVSVSDIASQCFGFSFTQQQNAKPVRYNMKTLHASIFNGSGHYQYTAKETFTAIRAYVQAEELNKGATS